MKKGTLLLLFAILLGSCFTLQAQVRPKVATKANVIDASTLKVDKEFFKVMHATRGIEDKKQEPKWMTIVPMDSSYYQLNWKGFSQDSYLEYSTVIPSDVVAKFVGNKVTQLKMVLPTNGYDPSFWIIDANDGEAEPLWITSTTGTYEGLTMLTIDCDWTIDKVRDLQVGWTVNFKKGVGYSTLIVPCFRGFCWLYYSNDPNLNPTRVFDYSSLPLKDWNGGYKGIPIFCVTEGEGGFAENGIEILGLSHSKAEIGKTAELSFTLSNYGCSPVRTLTYECVAGEKVIEGTTEGAIPFLGSAAFKANVETGETAERIPLSVEIKTLNGATIPELLRAEGSLTCIDPAKSFPRKVVMEEYTGAWCGWCPRGSVGMEFLSEEYPEEFIPIAIHFNDIMQDNSFYDLLNSYPGGFPGCILNRLVTTDPYYGDKTGTPMGIDDLMVPMIQRPTEAKVAITDVQYDSDKQLFSISTETVFNIDCAIENPSYSLAFVFTEDSVSGKGLSVSERKEYMQANYFSNATSYNSDPFLKPYVSKSQYYEATFNHVARFTENPYGTEGSLAAQFKAGDVLKYTYEMDLPANIRNAANTNVVVLLIDNGSGEIVNAAQWKMKDQLVAIDQTVSQPDFVTVNPVEGGVSVEAQGAKVSVYTLDGKMVKHQSVDGNVQIPLGKSVYVVRVEKGQEVFVKKIAL